MVAVVVMMMTIICDMCISVFQFFYSKMLSVSITFYSWIVNVYYPDTTLTIYNLQHWKSMQQERFYEFYSEFIV
jgi:hypothetical protein